MIGGTAAQAGSSAAHSADDVLVRDFNIHCRIDLASLCCQGLGKALRLRDRAGESVQNISLFAVRFMDPVKQHADGHFVRHQSALVHVLLGFFPERGSRLDVCAEDVARGNVRNAVSIRDLLCLCSLTGTGGAEHHDFHSFPPVLI